MCLTFCRILHKVSFLTEGLVMKEKREVRVSTSFVTGVIALVFMIIGYQTALFVHSAAVTRIAANRDEPDTVFIIAPGKDEDVIAAGRGEEHRKTFRKNSQHSKVAQNVRKNLPRKVESFRFNPNTVSLEDLQRLGFSAKQAQSIINYREKGGRFRRKSDFAKSYVVADSVYKRLEPYISIPRLDLNKADSADFDALPGIGGWFASKMVAYRKELGGYSYKEQLMEIWKFDREKFDGLSDLVYISSKTVTPFRLWQLPVDSIRRHPYIKDFETARAIVFYRENNPKEKWTVQNLASAGVISTDSASKLSRCHIATPE